MALAWATAALSMALALNFLGYKPMTDFRGQLASQYPHLYAPACRTRLWRPALHRSLNREVEHLPFRKAHPIPAEGYSSGALRIRPPREAVVPGHMAWASLVSPKELLLSTTSEANI